MGQDSWASGSGPHLWSNVQGHVVQRQVNSGLRGPVGRGSRARFLELEVWQVSSISYPEHETFSSSL